MNNRRLFGITLRYILPVFLITAVLVCITLSSCKQDGNRGPEPISSGKLRVGFIDSDVLIQDFPEIVTFFQEKERETARLRSMVAGGKELSKKQQEEIQQITMKFMKQETELLNKFVETLRESSNQIAEEKKLDLIINNKSSARVIEHGGTNVTEEVRAKIAASRKTKETPGENSGTPESTQQPSPSDKQ